MQAGPQGAREPRSEASSAKHAIIMPVMIMLPRVAGHASNQVARQRPSAASTGAVLKGCEPTATSPVEDSGPKCPCRKSCLGPGPESAVTVGRGRLDSKILQPRTRTQAGRGKATLEEIIMHIKLITVTGGLRVTAASRSESDGRKCHLSHLGGPRLCGKMHDPVAEVWEQEKE